MKTLDIAAATLPLADCAADLGKETLLITSHQKPIAVVMSLKGMDQESLALSLSADLARIIEKSRADFRGTATR